MCGGKYLKGKEEEADVWMRRKKNSRKKKEKKNRFWARLHDRWNACTKLLF